MPDKATVYKRFNKAVAAFFAGSAALVAFSGHTSGAPKIYIRKNGDEVQLPSVTLSIIHEGSLLAEVDDCIMQTTVQVDAWADDDIATTDALGAIEALTSQNAETQQDASFHTDGIRTVGMQPLAPLRVGQEVPEESNVFVSTAVVRIRWIDSQA